MWVHDKAGKRVVLLDQQLAEQRVEIAPTSIEEAKAILNRQRNLKPEEVDQLRELLLGMLDLPSDSL